MSGFSRHPGADAARRVPLPCDWIASITREAAADLELAERSTVTALVKASDVALAVE